MGLISKDEFICLDLETTGLEADKDSIIEVAATRFTFDRIIDSMDTLIDPGVLIPGESIKIHHITDDMVKGKPKIQDILPQVLQFVGKSIIVGHGIGMDIAFLTQSCMRNNIPCGLHNQITIDTLRMARLYGESPTNSLEVLRQHFNIQPEGAHRAMNDVTVNIEVFKYLAASFKTTEELLERLKKPIPMKLMPLGKHKGRPFSEIPLEYLQWAIKKDFDQDLIYSIKMELKKRMKGNRFEQASSPFSGL